MSSSLSEREIKMVRIQKLDKSGTTTYDENVMISILSHTKRLVNYLRIKVRGKVEHFCKLFSYNFIDEIFLDYLYDRI